MESGEVPPFLLMAVLAMAGRFSQDSYFENEQLVACERYSQVAWRDIVSQTLSSEQVPLDIAVVQATNMLAVVDFTGESA